MKVAMVVKSRFLLSAIGDSLERLPQSLALCSLTRTTTAGDGAAEEAAKVQYCTVVLFTLITLLSLVAPLIRPRANRNPLPVAAAR